MGFRWKCSPFRVIPLVAALTVLLFASLAEWLHVRRIRAVGRLAFGPAGAKRRWTRAAPFLRGLSLAGFAWGLATLLMLKLSAAEDGKDSANKNATQVVFVAELSPSMHLVDAGPGGKLTRQDRLRWSILEATGKSRDVST